MHSTLCGASSKHPFLHAASLLSIPSLPRRANLWVERSYYDPRSTQLRACSSFCWDARGTRFSERPCLGCCRGRDAHDEALCPKISVGRSSPSGSYLTLAEAGGVASFLS